MMPSPISIRTNNPGAMWLGPSAKRFGATSTITVGVNNVAVFPTAVQGAAAQFDLWTRSYSNMTLGEAIKRWSGGNSSADYAKRLCQNTGLTLDSVISRTLLAGPVGINLMKAQAQWEAGQPYPLSDDQWAEAQKMGTAGTPISTHAKAGSTGGAAGAGAAAAAHQAGFSPLVVVIVFVAVAAVVYFGIIKRG